MTETNRDRLVWVEIPATNLNRAKGFYEAVLQTALVENNDGPQTMQMIPCADGEMCGHLYEGKPATAGDGVTVHLSAAGELADAMERVKASGGEVISEVISIPSGAFFYAKDIEGNSLGIFKYSD
ncbi:VOC family protein [uncultured Parasphingorhabdus sp.]|uniref:VOC family protein n=1 Tax=uncultured Parasphingorhabdus sp. TaxID=2709694 RepID=UPI0030D82447|tara:strand:- start:20099 stop:20473 length:375 start_codon:yes stop_codon:yes gene_type:complete